MIIVVTVSLQAPENFRFVVEQTLREFFKALVAGKDAEQSWKKSIYKIIARLDDNVPEYFKNPNFLESLEWRWWNLWKSHPRAFSLSNTCSWTDGLTYNTTRVLPQGRCCMLHVSRPHIWRQHVFGYQQKIPVSQLY